MKAHYGNRNRPKESKNNEKFISIAAARRKILDRGRVEKEKMWG